MVAGSAGSSTSGLRDNFKFYGQSSNFPMSAGYTYHGRILKELSPSTYFRLPYSSYNKIAFEDLISLLYSTNSFGTSVWNTTYYSNLDPLISYINGALDSQRIDYNELYENFLINRSLSLFGNGQELYRPEEFAELRRVGDRLSIFQRWADYEYHNRS